MENLTRAVERIEAVFLAIARMAAALSAVGIAVLLGLLVASTLQRYLLQSPIPVTEELGGLLFLGIGFLSLAHGFALNRHVRLTLLSRNIPYPWKQVLEVVGYLLGLIGLVILIRVTYRLGLVSVRRMEHTEVTGIVLWPWRFLIPACLGLLSIQILLRALIVSLKLASGQVPPRADTRM